MQAQIAQPRRERLLGEIARSDRGRMRCDGRRRAPDAGGGAGGHDARVRAPPSLRVRGGAVRRAARAGSLLRQRIRNRDPGGARARSASASTTMPPRSRPLGSTVGRELPNVELRAGGRGGVPGRRHRPAASMSWSALKGSSTCTSSTARWQLLREHAERGVQIVASLPNSKLFEEDNPYHVTRLRL